MNYKKLLSSRLSNATHRSSDTSGAVVALLAGLAVGAVLGVLFAPDNGKKIRTRISDKALDLTDQIKDGYHSLKEHIQTGKEELTGLKNHIVDNVKTKANTVSQEFKEFKDAEKQKARSEARNAGHDPDNALQDI